MPWVAAHLLQGAVSRGRLRARAEVEPLRGPWLMSSKGSLEME